MDMEDNFYFDCQGRRIGELFWTIVCAGLAAPYVVGQSHSRSNFDVFTLASGGAVSHSYHESFSCVFLAALGLVDVVSVTFYDLVTRFGRPSIIALPSSVHVMPLWKACPMELTNWNVSLSDHHHLSLSVREC
jgi:hypothetical protein